VRKGGRGVQKKGLMFMSHNRSPPSLSPTTRREGGKACEEKKGGRGEEGREGGREGGGEGRGRTSTAVGVVFWSSWAVTCRHYIHGVYV